MSAATIQALGWSLIHFLWQGALVALVLELGLHVLRDRSARARYALRCAALATMALLPLGTFLWLLATTPGPLTVPLDDPRALLALLEAADRATEVGPLGWLVATWALGATVFALRLLTGWLRIRGLQRRGTGRPLPDGWQRRFDQLAQRMDVRAVARVIDSAALAAPTVIGWLKPVVLIPARALSGLTAEQLEAVLAHELAHIRRHDYLVNLIQSALEALLFYHPAVWWVSNGIRAEREFCCDDAALSLSSDGVVYARALATLEGWRSVQPEFGLSTLGGPLMTRIQRLIGIRPASRPARTPLTALGALLVLGCATAWAHGLPEADASQDPDQLQAIREHLDEMQQRLDELRAMIDEAAPEQPAWHERKSAFFDDSTTGEEEDTEWAFESQDGKRYRIVMRRNGGAHDVEWQAAPHGEHDVFFLEPEDQQVDVQVDPDDDGHRVKVILRGADGSERILSDVKTELKKLKESGALEGARMRHLQGDDEHAKKLHEHLQGLELHTLHTLKGLDVEELHEHLKKLHETGENHVVRLKQLHEQHGEHQAKLEKLHTKLAELLHGEHSKGDSGSRVQRFELGDGTEGEVRFEVILGDDEDGGTEVRKLKAGGKVQVLLKGDGRSDVQVFDLDELEDGEHFFGDGKLRFEFEGDGKGHEFFFRSDDEDDEASERVKKLKHEIQATLERANVRVLRADEAGARVLRLKELPAIRRKLGLELKGGRSIQIQLPGECEQQGATDCAPAPEAAPEPAASGQVV